MKAITESLGVFLKSLQQQWQVEVWLTSLPSRDEVLSVKTSDLPPCSQGYLAETKRIYFIGEELFADLARAIFAAHIPTFRPRGIRVTEESYAPTPT